MRQAKLKKVVAVTVEPGTSTSTLDALKWFMSTLERARTFPGVDEIEIRWPSFVVRHRPFDWMVDA